MNPFLSALSRCFRVLQEGGFRKSPPRAGVGRTGQRLCKWFGQAQSSPRRMPGGRARQLDLLLESLEPRCVPTLVNLATLPPNAQGPALVVNKSGDLFGTTYDGGLYNDGYVYELQPGTHTVTALTSFDDTNGSAPGFLAVDSSGNLFGTGNGGLYMGTAFELPNGSRSIMTLASFGPFLWEPDASTYLDNSDNIFGIGDYGHLYEVPSGNSTITTLAVINYSNLPYLSDVGDLVIDSSGNIFGVAYYGGSTASGPGTGDGAVIELPAGGSAVTVLASFDGNNGSHPTGFAEDSNGNFFGFTAAGGPGGDGTVFEVQHGSYAITTLASFDASNGSNPADLIMEPGSGILYGSTFYGGAYNDGTVFMLQPGSSIITTLASFDGSTYGGFPHLCGEDGNSDLFGATPTWGPGNSGTIFEVQNPLAFTTSSLADGSVSQSAYLQTIGAYGGTRPYVFSRTSGILPPGLSLSSGGVLSGKPTTSGTFSFTVTTRDSASATVSESFTVTINPLLAIVTTALPGGVVNGTAYLRTIFSTGGTGATAFTTTTGTIPPGLTLNSNGVLSGTPTAAGSYYFTVAATDSAGDTISQSYTVNISLGLSPANLTSWTINQPGYTQTISAAGGSGPSLFTTTAGTLPPGLTLTSDGMVSGTPTASGSYPFTVTATDPVGNTGSQSYTLIINQPPDIIGSTLPDGTVNQLSYSQGITTSGGTGPFTFGTTGTLPTGLTLSSGGVLSGTPTAAGTYAFAVTVTDDAGATGSQACFLTINPAVTFTTSAVANATAGQPTYRQVLHTTGGTGTCTFTQTAGTLPPGLTLSSSGILSGIPTAAGAYTFAVTASDSVRASTTQSYTITVNPPMSVGMSTLSTWTAVLAGFDQTLSVSGGNGSYTFSPESTLPAGLTLSSSGVISGAPAAAGNYTIAVMVTDGFGASASLAYTLTINPAVAITTASLTPWTQDQPGYSVAILATGGSGTRVFSAAGTMSPGLTLSTTGQLSGTPTAAGSYNFTVTATDALGATASLTYLVLINPAVMVATATLPPWTANIVGYSQTLLALGGTGSLTFTAAAGSLPPGLTLNNAGVVAGTPTTAGSYTFPVTATDSVGASGTTTFAVVINPIVTLQPGSLPADTVNVPYTQTIAAGGGTGDRIMAVTGITGAIPGLTVPTSGTNSLVITGTPTAAGIEKFTVTATDTLGSKAAVIYTLTVNATSASLSLPGSGYSGARNSTVLNYPISISQLSDTGTPKHVGLTSATLVLTYPTGVFGFPIGASLATSYVSLGSVPLSDTAGAGGSNDWTLTATSIVDGKLTINLSAKAGDNITSDTGGGTLVAVNFPILGTAPLGTQTIALINNSSGHTQIVGNNGTYTLSPAPPYSGSLTVLPPPLQVVSGSLAGTPSGFSLQFNEPILVNSMTPVLFGQGFGTRAPVPSVTLTQIKDAGGKPVNNPVEGSLVLDQATNSVTFVATNTALLADNGSPLLPDGTYKVDLTSSAATNGFQALGGGFLDGLASGKPGSGDYTTTFTVNAGAAGDDAVWIPPTADGPGQALSAPGNNQTGGGYPIYLSDATGTVTDVQLTFNYNPNLLTVTGVSGANFSLLASSTPGQAVLQYSGPALAAGTQTPIGFLFATVPAGTAANPTPYRAKDLLHLSGVTLNSGAIPAVTSDGLHLVAYVGDANGDGAYSSDDAAKIVRAEVQIDSGFSAYPLVDPVIVADTDGAGYLPADAGLQVNEAALGYPTGNLASPPVPPGVVFQPISNNVDPSLSIPSGLQVGADGVLTVPVNIDDPHPAGSTGLIEAHLALAYDPSQLSVSAADIHLGSVLSAGIGWSVTASINAVTGEIAITLTSTTPISSSVGGSLVTIDFHALSPSADPSAIVLVSAVNPTGTQVIRTELEDAQGTFNLSP